MAAGGRNLFPFARAEAPGINDGKWQGSVTERLLQETPMTLRWIPEPLEMGS